MAIRTDIEDPREEQRQSLARYRADYLAATAPLAPSVLSGALAGLAVYAVPFLAVLASFVLLRVSVSLVELPAQVILLLFGSGGLRGARAPVTPAATTRVTNVQVPTGVEATLDTGGGARIAVLLIAFWPLALLATGAAVAWIYRARRSRRLDDLQRAPIEFGLWPEFLALYALTAGAGLLVGAGALIALGANLIFSWAGSVIWRWLHDRILVRVTPATFRQAAAGVAQREATYQKELREGRL